MYYIDYYKKRDTDPMVFLQRFRCTTEPIGGGTEYDEEGELVSWDAAVAAIEIAKKQLGWHPASEPPTNEHGVNVKVVAQYPNGNYNEAWWRNGEWMFLSMDWEPVEIVKWCYPPEEEE